MIAVPAERMDGALKEFRIHFNEAEIENLQRRIRDSRFPLKVANDRWNMGTDSDYLQSLLNYWCEKYDWQSKEQELNRFPQYT